jgi:hypothetical protein
LNNDDSPADITQPLLIGDFYAGAYGPTIVLAMTSPAACEWLMRLFRDLAELGRPRLFTVEPEVRVANVHAIKMVRRPTGPPVSLHKDTNDGQESFVWSATEDGWLHSRDLVQSLCEVGSGHQYMNDERDDVALIELSLGEPDLLSSVRGGLEE